MPPYTYLVQNENRLGHIGLFPKRSAGDGAAATYIRPLGRPGRLAIGRAEQYNAVLVQALAFVAQASFILFYRLVYARFAVFCQRPLLGWWLELQLR